MKKPLGDCYEVAFNLVHDDDTLTLVHGWPVGQAGGTAVPGERFGHAWVERTEEAHFPANDRHGPLVHKMVIYVDKSNGKDVEYPQQFAYNVGRMDESHVARYTRAEAIAKMLEFKHYGPWDDEHPPLPDWADDPVEYDECLDCGEQFDVGADHECEEHA